jgi:tellurite resistance protein
MVLDARLKQLSAGASIAQGARAYVRGLEQAQALDPETAAEASDFRATLEAMYLMAAVDGEISDQELSQLEASIAAIVELHDAALPSIHKALSGFAEALAKDGWAARIAAVAAAFDDDAAKRFAFRLACGVALVDDHVDHAEAAGIDAFAAALGIGADESQEILRDVVEELFGG